MNRRLAAIPVAILVLVGASCSADPDNSATLTTGSGATTTTEAVTASPITTLPAPTVPGDVTVEVNPESLREGFEGPVAASELAFGQEAVEAMAGAPEERGEAAHSRKTLRTREENTAWLNSGDPKAAPVRKRVIDSITEVCGAEDVDVHMEQSQGWLLLVVRPGSQVRGLSYSVGGDMRFANSYREVGENDAYWLPVCTQGANQGDVVWDGLVRADCGNGGDKPKIRIKRPGVPSAPPVEIPPEPNEPPDCPWEPGVNPPEGCPKHPQSFDQQQNGDRPVHQGGQEPQGNNGVDTGPTTDGNGNTIPEPARPNPWNPPSGGSTPTTAPNPHPGDGYGGTGSGGTTPGGSTCTGGTCQEGEGGSSEPTVPVPGEGGPTGPTHDQNSGEFD